MSSEAEKVVSLAPYRERCARCVELEQRIRELEDERREGLPMLYPAQGSYEKQSCPFCGTSLFDQGTDGKGRKNYPKRHPNDLIAVPALTEPPSWLRWVFRWWRRPCGIFEAHLQRRCYCCHATWCERPRVLP